MAHQYPDTTTLLERIQMEQEKLGNWIETKSMSDIVLLRYSELDDNVEIFELIYRRPPRTIGIMSGMIDYDHETGYIRLIKKVNLIELDAKLFSEGMTLNEQN